MRIRLTRLEVKRRNNEGRDGYFDFKFFLPDLEYPLFLCASDRQMRLALSGIDGLRPGDWMLTDGWLRTWQVYLDGFEIIQPNEDPNRHIVHLPFDELRPALERALSGQKDGLVVEWDEKQMETYRQIYKGRAKIVCHNYSKWQVRQLLNEHLDAPCLLDCLKGLIRIAINNSNGKPVEINLQLDGWGNVSPRPDEPPYERPSFYWWIENVMRGGLIWHGDRYSTHT